jgi:hypothetical protein
VSDSQNSVVFPVDMSVAMGLFRVPDRGSVTPSPSGDGSYFSPQGRHSVFEEASAELKVDGIGKLEQPEITGYRPHGRSIRLTAVTRSYRLLAGGHSQLTAKLQRFSRRSKTRLGLSGG